MPDFDTSNIQDDDRVEIADLDLQNDGSSISLSLVLLRFLRKTPLFANTRARSTTLALLACVILLLFLVQPGLPDVPRRTSISSAQFTSSTVDAQSPLAIKGTPSTYKVTRVKTSDGKVIVIQESTGTMVWHQCRVQRWSILPKYSHPTVVMCT